MTKHNAFTSHNAWRTESVQMNFEPARLKSIVVKYDSTPYRVSRKLALARAQQDISVTCPLTGITSTLAVPAIPGTTLISEHPLSRTDNCRGLAQRGRSYLIRLDSVVLAGIFITLATEYELLSTGSQWRAHEANAALRTVSKEALVEAILLVECWIHSKNAIYLPRLSLHTDSAQNISVASMAGRITNWFQLLHDAIISPDTVPYNANQKPEKISFASVTPSKKLKKKTEQALILARRELVQDKKILKDKVPQLKSASSKMRNYILALTAGQVLVTADPIIIRMLCERIEACAETAIVALVTSILKKDRGALTDLGLETVPDDFLDDVAEPEESKPLLESMLDAPVASTASFANIAASTSVVEDTDNANANANDNGGEPEPSYAGMTPIQKILARKAWLRRTGRTEQSPFKTVQEEQAHFSIPSGTVLLAPKYEPSAEKNKLAELAKAVTVQAESPAEEDKTAGYIASLTGDDDASF